MNSHRTVKSRLIRILLLIPLLLASHQSHAANAFYDYLADFYLHESHQARNPDILIRYADKERGALLESVLQPNRIKAALSAHVDLIQRGEQVPDLPKLMQPLVTRYAKAFKRSPTSYEAEYLASLEASIEVMVTAFGTMNTALISKHPSEPSGSEAGKVKPLADGLLSLAKSLRDLSRIAGQAQATEIRNLIAQGVFTENGARRAEEIANKFASL